MEFHEGLAWASGGFRVGMRQTYTWYNVAFGLVNGRLACAAMNTLRLTAEMLATDRLSITGRREDCKKDMGVGLNC